MIPLMLIMKSSFPKVNLEITFQKTPILRVISRFFIFLQNRSFDPIMHFGGDLAVSHDGNKSLFLSLKDSFICIRNKPVEYDGPISLVLI